ncbi:MAG: PASTA domain-containing protein [Paludibacteraceae bacterium]|nr:PASTA domain-containing protein [Paludibacteraceae bacterium]
MKNFFKFFISKVFWINVAIAIILSLILVKVVLNYLDKYTEHGIEYEVPDLLGKTVEEAIPLLQSNHFSYEIIDSVYQKKMKPSAIVEQNPKAGASVKSERKIYLIINARSKQMVTLPNVTEMSSRQATALLQSVGLFVDKIEYIPSKYKDLVERVKYNGTTISEGTRIPTESNLVLVVGGGPKFNDTPIPDFVGMTLTDATITAAQFNLEIGDVIYDLQPRNDLEASRYVVYKQKPEIDGFLEKDDTITLWMSKNK